MPRILLFCLFGILLMGCAIGSSSVQNQFNTESQDIYNKGWQWEETITPVEKIIVKVPENYTIKLTPDGMAQIQFDCNRGRGSYTVSKNRLSFGPILSTRMACPPGSLDSQFAKDLQRVTSFFIKDNRLYLELPYDSGTMKFRPVVID